MSLVLHTFPISPRGFKVVLAAEHLGLDYELKFIDLRAGHQQAPDFSALNPNKRMPVLVDGDYVLWESNAILEYLAYKAGDETFVPSNTPRRLQMAKWLYWDGAHWDPAIAILMWERVAKPMMNLGETDTAAEERGVAQLLQFAPILDAQLARSQFVAGDAVTAADVSLASPLTYADHAGLPLAGFVNIQRWRAGMEALPAWRRVAAMQRDMQAQRWAKAEPVG